MEASVKTRFLVISDTHGMEFTAASRPSARADVVIHCGDLIEESKLVEFEASIRLLKNLDAPLKLVIPGNHDFTLDTPAFKKKVQDSHLSDDLDLVKQIYGSYGQARQLFESPDVKACGITLLDEGDHHFTLHNGASLKVYASAYTPSLGDWGFQYHPAQGRDFPIEHDVDVVITHGPPRGILDYTDSKQRAGCPHLFAAIARSRPRMHCFGHIHEGWGAKFVTWKDHERTTTTTTATDEMDATPTHFTAIDNNRSSVIATLSGLIPTHFDDEETRLMKAQRVEELRQRATGGWYATSHCEGDERPSKRGEQTLFVNAAVEEVEEGLGLQVPWLVDLKLGRGKAGEGMKEDVEEERGKRSMRID